MFGLPRGLELVIILLVVLLIFGPKNLPKLGKMFGKTVKNVRDGMEGVDDQPVATAPAETASTATSAPVEVTLETPFAEPMAASVQAPEATFPEAELPTQ